MYLADYHLHSTCSPDGEYTMAQMAEAAVDHGLQEICVTDHLDTIEWGTYAPRTDFPWPEALRQIEEARRLWGDRLTIRLGAELGEAVLSFDRAEQLLTAAPGLDFVIGSVHMASPRYGNMDLYYLPKADIDYYQGLIADYLGDVLTLARWGKFQVLGHLTLPLRYIRNNAGLTMDFSAHMDAVEEARSERKVASMSDCVHIFLIGPSGSGKTTLAKELEGRGYERILAYTTRPPRDNEDESSDYIFVTDEEFQNAFLDGELTCVRTYSTIFGTWSYGFAWSDLYRAVDSVAVIDPESYLRIYDQIENCFGIYLDIPDDVRKARLMIRGDNPEEIDRRLKTDAQDFAALDMCFKDVCKMRIGMVRRPDIDADRIEGHIRDFRSQIFRGKNMAHNEESNL